MGVQYNTSIVKEGLVFYTDAANIKSYPGSGDTVTDLFGNLTGSIVGASFTNKYFSFANGSGFNATHRIDFGNQSSTRINPNGFSVMCLVNNTADIDGGQPSYHRNAPFACGSDSILGNWAFERFRGLNNWEFRMKFDQDPLYGTSYSFGGNTVSQGSWQHLAVVYESSGSLKLYINGVLSSSHSLGTRTLTNAGAPALTIGATSTIYGFNGYFSQGIFYSRALTDNEISLNFNAVRGRYSI